jgi:hypothetical protein
MFFLLEVIVLALRRAPRRGFAGDAFGKTNQSAPGSPTKAGYWLNQEFFPTRPPHGNRSIAA